jgi:hypothetical protein
MPHTPELLASSQSVEIESLSLIYALDEDVNLVCTLLHFASEEVAAGFCLFEDA